MSELGKTIFAFICVTVFGVGVTGTGTELTTAATGNQTEPLTITRPQQLVEIIRVADNTAPEQPGLPYDEPAAEVFQTTTTSTIPVAPGFADAPCPDMSDIAIDVGGDPKTIARAQQSLADAAGYAATGRFDKAVLEYKQAWTNAVKALR